MTSTDAPLNYDNNNEANASKMKQQQQQQQHQQQQQRCASTSGSSTTTVLTSTGCDARRNTRNSSGGAACGGRVHLNGLWSVWYGFFGTFLQSYTAVKCTKRFLRYSMLPWTHATAIWELHVCLMVTGFAVLILPLFLAAAVFKIGNNANDGFKLGKSNSLCDKDPATPLLSSKCSLWRHGGPTAAFLHLMIAFSLLVPKLVMEARLVEAGFLPNDAIWRTDLDFMVVHHDRLVVLSFMTAASPPSPSSSLSNGTSTTMGTAIVQEPSSSSSSSTNASTSNQAPPTTLPFTLVKMLKDFFNLDSDDEMNSGFGSSVSVEYLNYALALFVYSVRYPAVFWNTNKCFGIIFSIQLLANGLQSLFAFAGMSVLYKVQLISAWKTLPLLRHYPESSSSLTGTRSPFVLNPHVTLSLYALSTLLVLSSSLILYLYGHSRFISFLNQQRDRKHIFLEQRKEYNWGYFTHCAALCVLIAVTVANAPLLYDYTVVYRGALDGAVLACIIATICHLFLWVLVWLFLTIKHKWTFKLRVTIGRATVRSARSIKLVTDVDLMGCRNDETSHQPLLIVGNGRTYTVTEHSPKKAIMSVIQKSAMDKKSRNTTITNTTSNCENNEDDSEEQIYWLRPTRTIPSTPDSATDTKLCWFSNKKRSNRKSNQHKVTFNEATSTSNIRNKSNGLRASGNCAVDEDDGDYATLRELPIIPSLVRSEDPDEDNTSEEGKLLACVHDDNVTYASTSRDLIPPVDYEDPSPLLTPEPLSDREESRTVAAAVNVTVHNHNNNNNNNTQVNVVQTPRCLRRTDSGMPHEEFTQRSDSISTESSTSPPEPPGSNNSETSSGVHSNASSTIPPPGQPVEIQRRATSVADLMGKDEMYQQHLHQQHQQQWKSGSLQRNIQPPQFATNSNSYNDVTKNSNGVPAVIIENSLENTVVIRRKCKPAPVDVPIPAIKEEPFGRSTNMRMTSFTEHSDLMQVQATSATLPHYPTQPVLPQVQYPHCSTMPLPHTGPPAPPANLGPGTSCNVYPRQHTTIPTHHNGVRLYAPNQNPYVKRFQNYQNGGVVRFATATDGIYGMTKTSADMYRYNSGE